MKVGPAGKQMVQEYEKILRDTGVADFPFVKATMTGKVGDPASPVGRRVDNKALLDMNAYLDSLPAPPGAKVDAAVAARGRDAFRSNCTQCHDVDQSKFSPSILIEMQSLASVLRRARWQTR